MKPTNLHTVWARLLMRALAESGLRDVVISPGSRSTPLSLAAARTSGLACHAALDERTAGFFALGQARVTGRPSAVVCTSGTAAAHYYPAVIEAAEAHVPLVVISADRPWELQGCSAPQTIDQLGLFGRFVRRFADVGLPDADPHALRALVRLAAQMAEAAVRPVPGPVHLNLRFRKPLEPSDTAGPEDWEADAVAADARCGSPRFFGGADAPSRAAVTEVAARCARAERGLIVCGPMPVASDPRAAREAILELGARAGFPVLAESTSQVRLGPRPAGCVMADAFDALLRSETFRRAHLPDLILELGAPPTSEGYARLVAEQPSCPRFVIAPHAPGEPSSTAAGLIASDPAAFARALSRELTPQRDSGWARAFARADERVWALVDHLLSDGTLSEGLVARRAVEACPEGSVLIVGNSAPVRDVDAYCRGAGRALRVLHQRGASGIDGLASGAAGAVTVSGGAVTLLLGDVSLLHDVGGLHLATAACDRAGAPLVMVVVQNDGGRIFERLPVGAALRGSRLEFERWFAMSHGREFSGAARMFGLGYARVDDPGALTAALAEAHASTRPWLIEAVVPPHDGAARASRLAREIRAEFADCPSPGARGA